MQASEPEPDTRVSLDQWYIFTTVVDCGGYSAAADKLRKSQSTISYAMQRLQSQLGLKVFEIRGRRPQLTDAGEALLRRARNLLDDASVLESTAKNLARGWEAEITVAVDVITPRALWIGSLSTFEAAHPDIRVEIVESALSGTQELIVQRKADLALCGLAPPGYRGERLARVPFIPVAHSEHALHRVGRELSEQDLRAQRQIVVRDSGAYRRISTGWLEAERRWTVSHFSNSIDLLLEGLGFAWIPHDKVATHIADGRLKALPVPDLGTRCVDLNMILPNRELTGPAATELASYFRANAARLAGPGSVAGG